MLVSTEKLTKQYGELTALNECSLQIQSGTVFGLLGPNGAGKTTLLRLLLGFLFPTHGSASINGYDCHRESKKARGCLTYLPGDAQLFGAMKGRKVLKFFSQVRIHIANHNQTDISAAAHAFKSSCAAMGTEKMTRYCDKLENLPSFDEKEAKDLMANLEDEYRIVIKALKSQV